MMPFCEKETPAPGDSSGIKCLIEKNSLSHPSPFTNFQDSLFLVVIGMCINKFF